VKPGQALLRLGSYVIRKIRKIRKKNAKIPDLGDAGGICEGNLYAWHRLHFLKKMYSLKWFVLYYKYLDIKREER
jgi:hypothetical protein